MKILFLQEQPCIRTLKYARGLRKSHDVELYFGYLGLTLNEFYGQGDEFFDEWMKIRDGSEDSLDGIASKVHPDIIHCHNGPDSLTVAAIHSFGGSIPIIHDVHDLMSLRQTAYDNGFDRKGVSPARTKLEERIALEKSDGIIAVSEIILDIASGMYNLVGQKKMVFHNYVIEDMIPTELKERLSSADGEIHIVYEGHLDGERTRGHYDLYDIFREMAAQAIHVHIYPSREARLYQELGEDDDFIHYHGHLPPHRLMAEMTQYDFGWSGFNIDKNRDHTDTVLANKTMEYISTGLPVISFPHKAQKQFIERYGVGIVIESLDDLGEKLHSKGADDIKKRVMDKRFFFTVENQIENVYRFYQDIIIKSNQRMKNEDNRQN